jgi:FixJ family two-component response regulator
MSSNDNMPSQAAQAAKAAGKREIERLTDPKRLGAADSLSAAVLTQRMLDAVISASAHAHAARAAAIVAGNEATETRDSLRRLRRTLLPLVAALAGIAGMGVGLVLSHLT